MSVMSLPQSGAAQPPPYPIWKITVAQYHQMLQLGLLTEDDPVELLEGWLVPKMPHNPPHDVSVKLTEKALDMRLPVGWHSRGQSAITLADSEPEPDLAIVRGDVRDYRLRHPLPADIAAVMEVSDTSLERDRRDKGRLYARAGIPIYWIINLVDRQVEVYTEPTGPDASPHYRQRQTYDEQAVMPLVLDGHTVAQVPVRELLP